MYFSCESVNRGGMRMRENVEEKKIRGFDVKNPRI
jgi:hypothetical protein